METEREGGDRDSLPLQRRVEYLRILGTKLGRDVQKLLLALVSRVKLFMQEPENRLNKSVDEYCKIIADTLDHTEIESVVSFC
jgi:hypothetical protein